MKDIDDKVSVIDHREKRDNLGDSMFEGIFK